jgi:hypothetical protein
LTAFAGPQAPLGRFADLLGLAADVGEIVRRVYFPR